jgi:hypothetical protein
MRYVLPALLCLLPSLAFANANEIFAEMMGRPSRPGMKASYELRQTETQPLKASDHSFRTRRHQFEASVPLSNTVDRRWKLHLGAEADEIRTNERFPAGRDVPTSLYDLNAGISYLRIRDNNHTVAGTFTVGSASNRPFGAFRDTSLQANLMYKVPMEGENAWIFLLNFSNNRGFAEYLPLPGAAYYFKATDSLRLALGVPFFLVFWSPFDKGIFSLSYFPLYRGQARFSYFFFGPAQAYVQAKYESRSHFLFGRKDIRERIFQEEANVTAGVSMPLERHLLVDLAAGYAFERKVYVGRKGRFQEASGQVLRPEKGPFASLKLVASF